MLNLKKIFFLPLVFSIFLSLAYLLIQPKFNYNRILEIGNLNGDQVQNCKSLSFFTKREFSNVNLDIICIENTNFMDISFAANFSTKDAEIYFDRIKSILLKYENFSVSNKFALIDLQNHSVKNTNLAYCSMPIKEKSYVPSEYIGEIIIKSQKVKELKKVFGLSFLIAMMIMLIFFLLKKENIQI
jgi:hypothetical protein